MLYFKQKYFEMIKDIAFKNLKQCSAFRSLMYIDYSFSCDMQKPRHKQLKYPFKQTHMLFSSHGSAIAGTAVFETTENTLDINIPHHTHNGIQKDHLFVSITNPK